MTAKYCVPLLLLLSACSSVTTVFPTKTLTYFAPDQVAEVIGSDSSTIVARRVRADVDSIYWISSIGRRESLPTYKVAAVSVRDYGLGGTEGIGLGALGGTIAGFVVAAIITSSWGSDPYKGLVYGYTGGLGLFVGGITGGIVGSIAGHVDTYVLADSLNTVTRSRH